MHLCKTATTNKRKCDPKSGLNSHTQKGCCGSCHCHIIQGHRRRSFMAKRLDCSREHRSWEGST